jgi:hypothetical protein
VPNYIQFMTEDGGTVLVEVEEQDDTPRGGVTKASGLKERLQKNIAMAQAKLDEALQSAVKQNVRPFVKSAQDLAKETDAVEMQVSFGLVMIGELGNVAVGKAGAQSNYTVTLKWTPSKESQPRVSGSQD